MATERSPYVVYRLEGDYFGSVRDDSGLMVFSKWPVVDPAFNPRDCMPAVEGTFIKADFNGEWMAEDAKDYIGFRSFADGYQQSPTSSSVVSSPFYWASAGYLKSSYLVDSEANYDYLRVYLDGTTLVFSESGSWKTGRKAIEVPQGWHTTGFEYSKDVSVDSGMDTALVDDLELGTAASGVFATPDFDGLDPGQTPDGWTATGYGGGWRTRGAVKPEVLLYEGNISPTLPQVDGLIYTPGAHEYTLFGGSRGS